MGNSENIIGLGGEYLCGAELMRPVLRSRSRLSFLFEAVLIGGKEPTYDYVVHLLNRHRQRIGASFFLQVKATMQGLNSSGSYEIDFDAQAVERAHALKLPFFLAVVDRSVTRKEKIFIKGLNAGRTSGIYRVRPQYDLADDAVKVDLYLEVLRLWRKLRVQPLKKFV